ncbi:MAG TPA: GTPase Era [Candidatus Binataceae bacterium]|jgi:GTP-binding protein Era|nr:GTPase Era [Candidatus Binataceae bacterium]
MGGTESHRAGFVALGGRPNVGKSTLLNCLVGQKVAIVTPRPQTTRRRILGIRSDPDAQLIFIDTPGLHRPRTALDQRMVEVARRCLREGEVVVGVVEARGQLDPGDREFLAELRELKAPRIIAINKLDLVSRADLIACAEQCSRELPEAEIVPVSALKGENVGELLKVIKAILPEGPSLMPEDEYTDQSERVLAAEIVREKVFLAMRQEVPFSTAVVVENFVEEPQRRLIRIAALIVVGRESHKGMLIGAGGRRLKEIGTAARLELEELFGARVFLELLVKLEKDWTRNPRKIGELGL